MTQIPISFLIFYLSIVYLLFLYIRYTYENPNAHFPSIVHMQSVSFQKTWKKFYRQNDLQKYRSLIERSRRIESNVASNILEIEWSSVFEDRISANYSYARSMDTWEIKSIYIDRKGEVTKSDDPSLLRVKMIESSRYEDILFNQTKRSSDLKTCILYIHGGGWVFNSPSTYERLGRLLAEFTGFNVFLPDYRKAPEYPHPYPLHDIIRTMNFLSKQSYTHIILMGDSAGGALATNLLNVIHHLNHSTSLAPEDGWIRSMNIVSTVLLYPALYYSPSNRDKFESYRGARGKTSPFINLDLCLDMWKLHSCDNSTCSSERFSEMEFFAPLSIAYNQSLYQSLPSTLTIVSESDVLYDDGMEYFHRLEKSSKQLNAHLFLSISNSFHGFMTNDNFSFTRKIEVIRQIVTFLESSLNSTLKLQQK